MKTDSIFHSSRSNPIGVSVYLPENRNVHGNLLFLHGFKGFKDWGFIPWLGNQFAAEGFAFAAINFSHNGIGDIPDQFTETRKFTENTFSLELEETLELIEAIRSSHFKGMDGSLPLGLIGHSRGGGIALLAGMDNKNVKAIATLASVSFFNRYDENTLRQWEQQNFLEVVNQRTGQVLQIGWNLHADLMMHIHDTLNIRKQVQEGHAKLCIVHGSHDEAIPFTDAENLQAWAGPEKSQLHRIEATGHTFGAVHPFHGPSTALREAFQHMRLFFHSQLHSPS